MTRVSAVSSKSGLTLIETLLYSGILAIFMLFTFLLVSELLSSNAQTRDNIEVIEEAEFILGKVNWAMSDAAYITLPATNTVAALLDVGASTGESRRFEVAAGGGLNLSIGGATGVRVNSAKTRVTLFGAENIYDPDTGQILIKIKLKVEKEVGAETVSVIASSTLETTYAL